MYLFVQYPGIPFREFLERHELELNSIRVVVFSGSSLTVTDL